MIRKLLPFLFFSLYALTVPAAKTDSISTPISHLPAAGTNAPFQESGHALSVIPYTSSPSSLYTGVPDITLPLYTIRMGSFSLPIALRYHASGIRVAQEASRVGLGWTLYAGGTISRLVRDLDDLRYPLVNPNSAKARLEAIHPEQQRTFDCEHDIFTFSFGNYSGRFFLHRPYDTTPNSYEGVAADPSNKLRIWTNNGTFYVQTPDNVLYTFAQQEVRQIYWAAGTSGGTVSNICGTPLSNGPLLSTLYETTPTTFDEASTTVTAWHLSRIDLPSGESATFQYDLLTDSYLSPMWYSRKEMDILNTCSGVSMSNPNAHVRIESSERLEMNHIKTLPMLNRIEWNGGYMRFLNDTKSRTDIRRNPLNPRASTQKPLKYIRVYNTNGRLITSYLLKHSYFYGRNYDGSSGSANSDNAYLTNRLKLNSLTQFRNTDSLRYSFSYYETDALPVKNTLYTDKWGYFTGTISNATPYDPLVADAPMHRYTRLTTSDGQTYATYDPHTPLLVTGQEKVKEGHPSFPEPTLSARTWTLKAMTTPLGGTTRFDYEPNTVYSDKPIFTAGDTLFSQTFTKSGEQQQTVAEIPHHAGARYLVLKCTYTGNNFTLIPPPFPHLQPPFGEEADDRDWWEREQNNTILSVSGGATGSCTGIPADASCDMTPNSVRYTFTRYYPVSTSEPIHLTISPSQHAHMTVEALLCEGSYERKDIHVGGLRIAQVTTPTGTRKFSYLGDNGHSSGLLTRIPKFTEAKEAVQGPGYRYTQYIEYSSTPCRSLFNPFSGQHIGYSKVTTLDVAGTQERAETYDFHYIPEGVLTSKSVDTFSPLNGKLLTHKIYSTDNVVQENRYTYEPKTPFTLRTYSIAAGTIYDLPIYCAPIRSTMSISRGTETADTTSFRTITDYEYNGQYNLSSITRNTSGEATREVIYTYPEALPHDPILPHDSILTELTPYNGAPSAQSLYAGYKRDHQPIAKSTYVDDQLQTRTLYFYDSSPQALPTSQYTFFLHGGDSIPSISGDPPINALPDVRYVYNRQGRVVSTVSRMGREHITLWGYKNQYVVAEIDNATLEEIQACGIDIDELAERATATDSPSWTILKNLKEVLPKALVTLREFIPLVGISKETSPSGSVTKYTYDNMNRLHEVKEVLGTREYVIRKTTYHHGTGQ